MASATATTHGQLSLSSTCSFPDWRGTFQNPGWSAGQLHHCRQCRRGQRHAESQLGHARFHARRNVAGTGSVNGRTGKPRTSGPDSAPLAVACQTGRVFRAPTQEPGSSRCFRKVDPVPADRRRPGLLQDTRAPRRRDNFPPASDQKFPQHGPDRGWRRSWRPCSSPLRALVNWSASTWSPDIDEQTDNRCFGDGFAKLKGMMRGTRGIV